MSRSRRLGVLLGGVCAPLVALGAWAGGAGASSAEGHFLSILPNPAVVGDRMIAGGGQSPETACLGDRVSLAVTRGGEEVFAQDAEPPNSPNSTGGWSIVLPPLEAATYEVTATCFRDGAQLFAYDPTTLVVLAQAPSPEPEPEPSPEPSVEQAPPATPVPGAPTFTG